MFWPEKPDPEALATYETCAAEDWEIESYLFDLGRTMAEEVERHLHGLCFAMAIAIRERTGWPIKILLDD
jgi:hypothetical protein